MANSIVTKFTIGTEQGISTILSIGVETAWESYTGRAPEDQLAAYIRDSFNDEVLHVEMNSMSNQFLVVYADDEPAGYARITTKGERPEIFHNKTVARIADFAVLNKFDDVRIKENLFEKCLAVSNMQQVVWMSEYSDNADLAFFESYGFRRNTEIEDTHKLDLNWVYLVKENEV